MDGPPVLSLAEAVTRYVPDGACVYIGNFGASLFSVGHEIIRQHRTDLHVVIASGGLLLDQLIAAEVLAETTFAHCWSAVGPEPAWNFRRLAESGATRPVRHEVSLGLLSAALTAAAWNVPFTAVPPPAGTGYVEEDWTTGLLDRATTRFGEATVIRAVRPDVAFVHVDRVDAEGNGHIASPLGEAFVAAQAAEHVVLVAEERSTLDPAEVTVPGLLTSAVVVHPGAVRPDGAVGRYERDVAAYQAYVKESSTVEGTAAWLARVRG